MPQPHRRILAAIMFTDIKGYTAMMQKDETSSLEIRNRHRQVFNDAMDQYRGEIIQYFGDGTLSIFYSAVDAVMCGIKMQERFLSQPKVPVRIGIHSGDIIYNNEEIIGDSVNIASRLEGLAIAGSLLISRKIYEEIANHPNINAHFVGKVYLKNVVHPLEVFSIINKPLAIPTLENLSKKGRVKPKTLAVLPFINMSNSKEDEFFCDGITEEILNVLAKIDALQVTSRTSSFFFKDKNLTIKEIGAMLEVSYILEGSIRKAGNKVRITAQLIQTSDDYHKWSERYDRHLEDIFSIQDDIAAQISKELVRELEISKEKSKPRRRTNASAHQFYLKGKYYFNQWNPQSISKGIEQFQKAIDIDNEYAEAYAGMASCYIWLGLTGYDSKALEKASVTARKGYELNEENEDALLAYAMVKTLYDKRPAEANILFTKAIRINPDYATAHHFYAMYLAHIGNLEQALVEYERAVILDPLSLVINSEYSTALANTGHLEQALRHIEKTIELNENFRSAWEVKGWIYYMMEDYTLSLEALTIASPVIPLFVVPVNP